ncbi:MAG TPA: tetratricopeptide repeat protein [Vicinamibacteria bacterium]|nr:tetratricopeptide repeat protein [Vicinamibacteria bacterium]
MAASCVPHRPAIRNVLLISVDTLRADHVGSYGFPRPTTPRLDAVAREGVVFANAYTPVPVTLPAHASLLTGTLPPVHGVRDNLHERLPDASRTLAEMLKERGFATAAVVSSFVLDRRFNLSQGFSAYEDRFQAVHRIGDVAERKGDETSRVATAWLERHGREPFFLFVHFYDPHDPYEPPEPFASQWKGDEYSGEIAFADHCAGQVLDKLRELGLYESTLIVVTGDHGEMLGEHGELNHGFFIYESALRVPLVFRVPGASPRAARVDRPVSLVDVVPTVAALLGIPVGDALQGVDLSPWLRGEAAGGGARSLYAETVTPTRYYGTSSLLGVIKEGWKYIETSRPELYDLRQDPAEANDLAAKEPARAEALGGELKRILAASLATAKPGEAAGLDEDARRRLESLGYLSRGGGAEIVFDRSKEDPKDLISFFRSDQRLSRLVEEKKYDEARVLCEEMLRQRPGFADCHLQMSRVAVARGDPKAALEAARRAVALAPENEAARLQIAGLLRGRGEVEAAITHYRQALEARPDSLEARTRLGRALADGGRLDEAVSVLRPAVDAWPQSPEAATQLGFALARQGRLEAAIDSYRRALALDSASAEAHAYLGSALASQGKLDEAIPHFELALRTKPDHAELHDWLGVALREKGRTEEALGHFREAVRLDPRLAVAHFNLGRALKQQGQPEEAMREYRRALELDPRMAAAHNGLGTLLGSRGRPDEAARHFREALRLQPDDAEAHNNLGLALRMLGKDAEAISHFRAALLRRQDWPAPMGELAWILATHADARLRDPAEAQRLAERAAELTARRDPAILDALAASYASAGDWGRAAATAEAALALAPPRSAMADEIAGRLSLYRSGKAYRERPGGR